MATKISVEEQAAVATAKFIRMSPTKARQVVDLIRGRHVDEARRVLRFTQRAASVPVGKVLESAIANAEHNRGLPGDELVVKRAWVDEGPTLRRFRPRALGRATRIRKRTCHISVVVGRSDEYGELSEAPVAPVGRRARRRSEAEPAPRAETTEPVAPEPTAAETTEPVAPEPTVAETTTAPEPAAPEPTEEPTEERES